MRTVKMGTNRQIVPKEFEIHQNLTGIFWQTQVFSSRSVALNLDFFFLYTFLKNPTFALMVQL